MGAVTRPGFEVDMTSLKNRPQRSAASYCRQEFLEVMESSKSNVIFVIV